MRATSTVCRRNKKRQATETIRLLYLVCGIALIANFATILFASFGARGLFADAAASLVVIYEGGGLQLFGTRAVVELLREAPIILLSRYSSASLFECGQAFTFVMLALPTALCGLCWLMAPRHQRGWILFPLAFLFIGFAATSTHAVGEAAIAASYYWILLFQLLFKTRTIKGQLIFWLLCIPAFELHEGALPLTSVLLLAIALRVHAAARERCFAVSATLLLGAIFAYQLDKIINPNFPGDRAHIITGLTQFEFLYAGHHFNLPLVTGTMGLLALSTVFFVNLTQPKEIAVRYSKMIVFTWIILALLAAVTAMISEQSFAPYSQIQARYHPVIVGSILGTAMILLLRFQVLRSLWMNPATVAILISLCAAQAVADVVATRRWNDYIADLQSRLTSGQGLIPWETTLHTGDERVDTNWRIFKIEWIIPYMCVVFVPNGVVRTMIDLPADLAFRPLDPEKPDRFPKLRGIDFGPYERFLASQKSAN